MKTRKITELNVGVIDFEQFSLLNTEVKDHFKQASLNSLTPVLKPQTFTFTTNNIIYTYTLDDEIIKGKSESRLIDAPEISDDNNENEIDWAKYTYAPCFWVRAIGENSLGSGLDGRVFPAKGKYTFPGDQFRYKALTNKKVYKVAHSLFKESLFGKELHLGHKTPVILENHRFEYQETSKKNTTHKSTYLADNFMPMDFIPGNKLFAEKKPFEEMPYNPHANTNNISQWVEILLNVCRNLENLQLKGIVHNDLNIENILRDTNNKTNLIDFGRSEVDWCGYYKDIENNQDIKVFLKILNNLNNRSYEMETFIHELNVKHNIDTTKFAELCDLIEHSKQKPTLAEFTYELEKIKIQLIDKKKITPSIEKSLTQAARTKEKLFQLYKSVTPNLHPKLNHTRTNQFPVEFKRGDRKNCDTHIKDIILSAIEQIDDNEDALQAFLMSLNIRAFDAINYKNKNDLIQGVNSCIETINQKQTAIIEGLFSLQDELRDLSNCLANLTDKKLISSAVSAEFSKKIRIYYAELNIILYKKYITYGASVDEIVAVTAHFERKYKKYNDLIQKIKQKPEFISVLETSTKSKPETNHFILLQKAFIRTIQLFCLRQLWDKLSKENPNDEVDMIITKYENSNNCIIIKDYQSDKKLKLSTRDKEMISTVLEKIASAENPDILIAEIQEICRKQQSGTLNLLYSTNMLAKDLLNVIKLYNEYKIEVNPQLKVIDRN